MFPLFKYSLYYDGVHNYEKIITQFANPFVFIIFIITDSKNAKFTINIPKSFLIKRTVCVMDKDRVLCDIRIEVS
jgi:hypothetical protein